MSKVKLVNKSLKASQSQIFLSEKIQALNNLLQNEVDVIIYENLNIVLGETKQIEKVKFKNHLKDYKILDFVNCFNNDLSTRIRCPRCNAIKNSHNVKAFKTTKACCTHLVSEGVHDTEINVFPTISQSLKLLEAHSLALQLKLHGERI